MQENNNVYKCEQCGSDCEYFRSGMSQGWKCTKCDFGIVTTYDPFYNVPDVYEISIMLNKCLTAKQYRYLSKLLGLNYLQLKQASESESKCENFKIEKDIYETLNVMEELKKLDVDYSVSPDYPYHPNDEIYQKIKNNTVFE